MLLNSLILLHIFRVTQTVIAKGMRCISDARCNVFSPSGEPKRLVLRVKQNVRLDPLAIILPFCHHAANAIVGKVQPHRLHLLHR